MCLMAISKDFLERVLPNPVLSGDEVDFPEKFGDGLSSCGGGSFLMLTTRSTILVPIKMGLTLSLTFGVRLNAGTELPLGRTEPFDSCPLDGEQDCLFGLPTEPGSIEDERALDKGLPLEADNGPSLIEVLKFGGASIENPEISEGFQGVGFIIGESARDGAKLGGAEETDLTDDEFVFFVGVLLALVSGLPEFTDRVKNADDLEGRPDVLFVIGDGYG